MFRLTGATEIAFRIMILKPWSLSTGSTSVLRSLFMDHLPDRSFRLFRGAMLGALKRTIVGHRVSFGTAYEPFIRDVADIHVYPSMTGKRADRSSGNGQDVDALSCRVAAS
jgi:hypothetical protein